MTETMECIRATAGDSKRELAAFAQLRPVAGVWPFSGLVNVMRYGSETGLIEGKQYVVTIVPTAELDAESKVCLLDDVWKLSVDGEVEFHRLTRAVLRPVDGPYEITPANAWGQALVKALPKDHPVWQFIKVR